MIKRSRDRAQGQEVEGDRLSKKARKESKNKSEDTQSPITASESKESKEARRAKRKEEKRRKKQEKEESADGAEELGSVDAPEPVAEAAINGAGKHATTKQYADGSLYKVDPALAALPQTEVDAYLSSQMITITDPKSTILRPITSFSFLPFGESERKTVFGGFKSPTPIQAAAWPFLLSGRDVIGVAETGSGKTMAFAVPCVHSISSLPAKQRRKGARALVVSPTRELAMQSYEQILKLGESAGIQVACIYGGVPKDGQRKQLQTAEIVVATPGRLNDLINEGHADLSTVTYVVLDEADRMLDKGFEDDIRKIVGMTPERGSRQTLMFTATWPESVRSLAATFMVDPVRINIGENTDGDLRANTRIEQRVEVVEPRGKEYRLLQLLKEHQTSNSKEHRVLVFCLYKKEATRVEGFIRSKGFRVASIHGDLSQEQRTRSLDDFKKAKCSVLVATDVAARGLDIPDVPVVINCTFPLTVEDYVHRIGRTGRAGKHGTFGMSFRACPRNREDLGIVCNHNANLT